MGLPGLNFAIAGSAHWYHTPGDSPENLSPASLQHMGDNGLAMARLLADSDLTAAPAGERVYFHVPGLGLMGYGPGWAVPLAILLLAAFLATTVLAARRGRLRWWALPVGLLAALVALVLSVLVPHWLWSSLQGRHPEWGAIVGRALYREWPYALAMVALATVAVTGIFGLLRRWVGLEGLSLGALVLPLTGAVASAALLPAGSYLLLWPSLLAVGMVTLLTVIPTGEPVPARADPAPDGVVEPDPGARASRRRLAGLRAVLVLGGLGILLIMIPVLFLVHVMLSIAVAPLLGATAALLALLLLPLLDMLSRPNRWWLPATGLVAAGAFLALGASATVGTPERPAPGNLLHLQDDLSGTSLWASPAYHDDPFTAALLADAPDTLRLDAYSWTLRGGRYRAAPAPSWPAPPVPIPPWWLAPAGLGHRRGAYLALASWRVGVWVTASRRAGRSIDSYFVAERGLPWWWLGTLHGGDDVRRRHAPGGGRAGGGARGRRELVLVVVGHLPRVHGRGLRRAVAPGPDPHGRRAGGAALRRPERQRAAGLQGRVLRRDHQRDRAGLGDPGHGQDRGALRPLGGVAGRGSAGVVRGRVAGGADHRRAWRHHHRAGALRLHRPLLEPGRDPGRDPHRPAPVRPGAGGQRGVRVGGRGRRGRAGGLRAGLDVHYDADRVLAFVPATGAAWLPLHVFFIYLAVQWWAQYFSDGSGYLAQRLFAAKDDAHAEAGGLWFVVANYALRTWPWVLIGLVALVVFPLGIPATRRAPRWWPRTGRWPTPSS
jgi:hypothetical protein